MAEISLQVDTAATEEHEAQLVRVEDDHTLAEALEVLSTDEGGAPSPSWLFAEGGVGSIKGGKTATVTQTSGKYAFICFISDRAGGPPHAAMGMINEIVVE